jgi:hemerythrin superfamily protein
MPAATPHPATDDAPVQGFSDCHAGIVAQLDQFARLPVLVAAATQARAIAKATERFFREVVVGHHGEEEQELFPAVLASARPGVERDRVKRIVERLTQEHRRIEKAWHAMEPLVHLVARGHDAALDTRRVEAFVAEYKAHAANEERVFLPLASTILGRDGNHMAALGLSLHARHALPEVLRRFGTHL